MDSVILKCWWLMDSGELQVHWASGYHCEFLTFRNLLITSHGRSSEHHRWVRKNPFCILSCFQPPWMSWQSPFLSILCYWLPTSSSVFLFFFLFTVPCTIVLAKPEDLQTWSTHLSFRLSTRVKSSSYSPMGAWIFLQTSSKVTWSLYEMSNSLR